MICHKMGVAIENIKVFSLYPFFKMGKNILITQETHKNIMIGSVEVYY